MVCKMHKIADKKQEILFSRIKDLLNFNQNHLIKLPFFIDSEKRNNSSKLILISLCQTIPYLLFN
ncbi:hypothetical protein BpHYR1_005662 [Brachionus plicatilis]|uniref:Uncharacterized protein n=1 Tax=Brachionus plicatilis TaxID=10195 RepID=A0A3M7Q097_BRAPC|nr:hypothetical protein BpHYR1_005662 [Brachionus plicatilis]